jgi:hypothetical protein
MGYQTSPYALCISRKNNKFSEGKREDQIIQSSLTYHKVAKCDHISLQLKQAG